MSQVIPVLEDLVEIDSLILDLDCRDYATAAAARKKLKRKCSHDWKAFTSTQERAHDRRIPGRARSKLRKIIRSITR
jgi:hypothetical protein